MNILVCPDKFKGSLTAVQVCQAIAEGIQRFSPAIDVTTHPLADGGDGMLDILVENIGLRLVGVEVRNPVFRPITAHYGISRDGATAYVEMSRASGLVLLEEAERNCLETTTYGTGELIGDAVKRGVRHIIMGMGGSATNDAGIGMAAALGYRFLGAQGNELSPVGKNLGLVSVIDDRHVLPELANVKVDLASDVQNVFHGQLGAAWTFARQKGADDAGIALLDSGLQNIAQLVAQKWSKDIQGVPGAGAAGGLGGGAIAFLDANLGSGIEMMIAETGLDDKLAKADLVITGEGKLDSQTLDGKVIDGVVKAAASHAKKVAVLCGAAELPPARIKEFGIFYCDQIMSEGRSLQDCMANGYQYLEQCAFKLIRILHEQIP